MRNSFAEQEGFHGLILEFRAVVTSNVANRFSEREFYLRDEVDHRLCGFGFLFKKKYPRESGKIIYNNKDIPVACGAGNCRWSAQVNVKKLQWLDNLCVDDC